MALHAGLLVERATHRETLDAAVVFRWVLSIALLVIFRRLAAGAYSFRSPTLGIAAVLIFALIHTPVAAPEPSLPLAATGFGLALSLAVVDRRCDALAALRSMVLMAPPVSSAGSSLISRETLKDRAPPVAR
ncbi:MAG: hypothetical protein JJE39_18075 [Vicinamibacteria bacterium]|nr:hypothetical protein [Vicinamibacteria bacterium]